MAPVCPYCRHEIAIKDPKVGRFKIRCPHCQERSVLNISQQEAQPPRADLTPIPKDANSGSRETPAPAGTLASDGERNPDVVQAQPAESGTSTLPPEPSLKKLAGVPAGFKLIKFLRQEIWGKTYLADDMLLGRRVRIGLLREDWCNDAGFVAKTVREAFAAAQLIHPNLVQIHGFRETNGRVAFITEGVEGKTLAELLAVSRKLAPGVAASHLLQAARGLKAAHDQNMIHGRLDPDHVLVCEHGIVKVDGLGLMALPPARAASYGGPSVSASSMQTQLPSDGSARISPYQSPEQAIAEGRVDYRADLYSLGATLYTALTGNSPLISAPEIPDCDAAGFVREGVPQPLAELFARLLVREPGRRNLTMADVIQSLERYLGFPTAGPFIPREVDAKELETAALAFHASPMAALHPWFEPAFGGFCLLVALLLLWAGKFGGATMVGILWAATTLAYFLICGLIDGSPLFSKFRELLVLFRKADWATLAFVLVLAASLILVFHWTLPVLLLAMIGSGLAVGMYFGVDRPLMSQRNEPLDRAERLFASMRSLGVSEDSIRWFVWRYAGRYWEEFYENLFGYEAKRDARLLWEHDSSTKRRPTFAPWRDPVHDWLCGRIAQLNALNDRGRLQPIEEAGFIAEGKNLVVARRRARKTSAALVKVAAEIRDSALFARRHPDVVQVKPRTIQDAIREAVDKPDHVLQATEIEAEGPGLIATLGSMLIGARIRFLVGAALVVLCMIWAHQNEIFSATQLREQVEKAIETQDINVATNVVVDYAKQDTVPLVISGVPPSLLKLFNGWGTGAAGLILIVSSMMGGSRIAFFAIPAAVVALMGRFISIPAIGPLNGPNAAMAVGAGILVAGVLFGRSRR